MSDLQAIEQVIQKAALRRRWLRGWRGFWHGLFAGASLWVLLAGLYKLLPFPPVLFVWAGAGAVLLMLGGFLHGWCRRMTPAETARFLDEKQRLQERLSTALEVAQGPAEGEWKQLVIADAALHARGLDPRRLMPHHLPRIARWTAVLLAAAVGLGFVPEYRTESYRQRKQEAEIIQDAGRRLVTLVQQKMAQPTPLQEETRENLAALQELGEKLSKAQIQRSEALREVVKLSSKLQEEYKEHSSNPLLKQLQKANRRGASSAGGGQSPSGEKSGPQEMAEAMEKWKDQLQKAQQTASSLGQNASPSGDQAQQALAESLASLAQQAADLGQTIPNLQEAIEALKAGDTSRFLQEMDAALTDLEKMQATAESLQKLQQQATQLARELSEQLEKGQVEAAARTLERMAQQLKESSLSEAQQQQILQEVSKALGPAGEYGKVGDLLKQAVKSMQAGSKQEASQSLAQAADELQKMMEQLQDADALKQALDALRKAETAIATRREWGECPSCREKGGT